MVAIVSVAAAGCRADAPRPPTQARTRGNSSDGDAPPVERARPTEESPVRLRVFEQHSTVVPGLCDHRRLGIGNIERGRVRVTLEPVDGPARVLQEAADEGCEFILCLDAGVYRLVLESLHEPVFGRDYASFSLQRVGRCGGTDPVVMPAGLSETDKIDLLIERIGELSGATFIRNGAPHDAKAAAEHLRRKWEAAGDHVQTARDFIGKIATRSSTSGEPYTISFNDGRQISSAAFLHDELRKIEQDAGVRDSAPTPKPAP
ncbi:MAG: DUF5329 family protein [Phycisphaerales bacterium]|nr:DUF5329 family protein [Phycisphaerales bacterium]